MRIKSVAVPLLLSIALAGCGSLGSFKVSAGGATATCSVSTKQAACSADGHSVTVAPGEHASGPAERRSPLPVASTPPVPASPVVAATPTAPSATAPEDPAAAVQSCMGQFPTDTRDTLVSFTTSDSARQDMATCLQIPPETMALFLRLLFQYAYSAYVHGDFNSTQGQQQFTTQADGDTLPHAVDRCRQEA